MKEQKKQPELRFKGFTDDWEQVKLKDIVIMFDENRIPIEHEKRKSGKYPYYGASGIIDYVDNYIFEGEFVLLAEDGANIIMRNTPIAYLTNGRFWVNNHAHIMSMINGSNLFLLQILEKQNYIKYNSGTAQPKLNSATIRNIIFNLPKDKEQKRIGEFFQKLDQTITLQQRKLELLKKIKQGYLQQLFPSKGQSIPNIRFSEFKENWIQKKLGNYLSIPEKKQVDNLKDLKLMTLKLNLGGINLSANRETLELGATKYFVRKSGQLIYGKQNFFHGSIAIIPDNADGYATSGDVPALDIEGIQPKFLLDYISRPSYYLEKEARAIGTGSKRIHEKDLFSFEISSPSQIEQIKITNIVDNMDKILIFQKSKIQKLKQLKQAYLQKLFP